MLEVRSKDSDYKPRFITLKSVLKRQQLLKARVYE